MQIQITNLTNSQLSTTLGVIAPLGSAAYILDQSSVDKALTDLVAMESRGLIKLLVSSDSVVDRGRETQTTKAATLYVDPVNGLDTNDGSGPGKAFRTLTAALSTLPIIINHDQTINIAAGTLVDVHPIIPPPFQCVNGSVVILGAMRDYIPAQGSATGTFDASFTATYVQTATVAGANWAVDGLRGQGVFVEITSGPNLGLRLPILSNAAATIDVGAPLDGNASGVTITSATFKLVVPATVLQTTSNTDTCVQIRGGTGGGINTSTAIANPTLESGNASLRFQQLMFSHPAGIGGVGVRLFEGAGATFYDCAFVDTNLGGVHIQGTGAGGSLLILRCSFSSGTTASGTSINVIDRTMQIFFCTFSKMVIGIAAVGKNLYLGAAFDGVPSALSVGQGANVQVSYWLMIRNATNFGISIRGGGAIRMTAGFANRIRIDSCAAGIDAGNFGVVTFGLKGSFSISASAVANAAVMNANGIAIKMECFMDGWLFGGTAGCIAITNSTTWGVQMAPALNASQNTLVTNAGLSMSGNTTGDFAVDGTTNTTLAALRAANPKRVVDANSFNRLVEV